MQMIQSNLESSDGGSQHANIATFSELQHWSTLWMFGHISYQSNGGLVWPNTNEGGGGAISPSRASRPVGRG
jgi:hypothetical protein